MHVKLFSKLHLPAAELDLSGLEDEINAWLARNTHIKVVDIKQSASGGSLAPSLWLVTVWYVETTCRTSGPAEWSENPPRRTKPEPGNP